MIFTTWNFGAERAQELIMRGSMGLKVFGPSYGDQGRAAARQYAADIFNWCAAKRDYPYADHPEPTIPWPLHWCAAVEIKHNCVREFNR